MVNICVSLPGAKASIVLIDLKVSEKKQQLPIKTDHPSSDNHIPVALSDVSLKELFSSVF